MNFKKMIIAVSTVTIALCAIFYKDVRHFVYHLPIMDYYFKYVRKEKKVDDHHVETTLFNGYKIIVNSDDGCVCRRVRGLGIWEAHEVKVLKDILKTGMRVVEIGANYGTHTLYISELVGPTGQVIAFECNPFVSSKLKKSLEINNITNCILKEVAVSDHAYDTFIVYNLDNIGGGYILSEEDAKTFDEKSSTLHHKILVTTLDTELKDVHDIDLLKIDAEGSEYLILQGGKNFIQRHPKMKIMMEWAGIQYFKNRNLDHKRLANWIKDHHFKVYDILDNGDLKLIEASDLLTKEFSDLLLVPVE